MTGSLTPMSGYEVFDHGVLGLRSRGRGASWGRPTTRSRRPAGLWGGPKGIGGRPKLQRANLRALRRHLYREKGTWIAVAHGARKDGTKVLRLPQGTGTTAGA